MKKILKHLLLLTSLTIALSPVTVVYARGSGDSAETSGHSSENETQSETETEQQRELQERQQELAKHQAEKQAEIEKKLNERAKELEKEGEKERKHTPEERKKTCLERKASLEQKLVNIKKNSQKHQDKITSYLDKALKYKDDNKITDTEVASAILKAIDAKAASAASVAALQKLSPSIDCTSGAVATDVATFKAAAEQARNDLKNYRSAVKVVFEALEKAKEQASNSGGEQQ